ncbi:unnamed protein product [Musa hybrid cultivar]
MSGSGSDEAEAIARASAAAEELYRLRDTYFPRDPEEKTSKLRTLADTALALLDSLPLGTTCAGGVDGGRLPRSDPGCRVGSSHLGLECGDMLRRVKAAIVGLQYQEAKIERNRLVLDLWDKRRSPEGVFPISRSGSRMQHFRPRAEGEGFVPRGQKWRGLHASLLQDAHRGWSAVGVLATWALLLAPTMFCTFMPWPRCQHGLARSECTRSPSRPLSWSVLTRGLQRKSPLQRANYEYLRGKMLDVFPDYIKEAEDHLSKAVKLNPSLADAWLCLGNCIWKKGDLPSAKNCFSLALSKGPNKKILCQLSMLERSLAQGAENKAASIEESIKHAREAVMLDIKDGNSWYNLGNACLTSFFVTGAWDHAKLQQSLKAYQNAEKDELMHSNPDLYFNCASANKYLENYERALHGFEAAASKDPGLNADDEAQKITSLLDKIESSLRGLSRSKRLASLVSSLGEVILKSSHGKATVNVLKEGLNKAVAIIGKVLLFIKHENVAPLYYLICDSDQTCFVLSVYGLHSDAIKEGERVILMEPHYRVIDFSWKGTHYHFQSIRVDFVEQLLVNEKVPAPHHLVRACIHAQHKA